MNIISLKYEKGHLATKLLVSCIVFFIAIVLAGMASMGIESFFQPHSRDLILSQSVIQNIVAFFGAAVVTAYIISSKPFEFLGINRKCSVRPFIGVMIVFIIGLPFMNQLIHYNSIIKLPEAFFGMESAIRQMEDANGEISEIILSATSVGGLLTGILIVGILTGFGEEVLFRGMLQNIIVKNSSFGVWGIWLAAFVFSFVHLQFYGFFPRLLLGAFFGYLLYSTGSLWPGVFAHALNNSIVVVMSWLRATGHDIQSADNIGIVESGFPWPSVISLVSLILFFYFGYNYFFNSHGFKK